MFPLTVSWLLDATEILQPRMCGLFSLLRKAKGYMSPFHTVPILYCLIAPPSILNIRY